MATYYSDRAPLNNSASPKGGFGYVKDRCVVTIGSVALATNDVINLFVLPKGSLVTGVLVTPVGTIQSGTDSVYTIGDSGGDTDRYVNTANGTSLRSNISGYYMGLFGAALTTSNTPLADDTTIIMTITTGGTGMATDRAIIVNIEYYIA